MPLWDRNRPESHRPFDARQPLPNYRSRAVQLRLFVLVSALMIVLIAMNEARKPGMWAWMWRGESPAKVPGKIDTRLAPRPSGVEESAGTVVAKSLAVADSQPLSAPNEPAAKSDRESAEAWRRIWDSLTRDEQLDLERLLRGIARRHPPTADEAQRWSALAIRLDKLWQQLLNEQLRSALETNADTSAEQRRAALQRLSELESEWKQRLHIAFIAASSYVTDEQLSRLRAVRQTVDANALQRIRDDTVWRHDERAAWFRLVERLQTGELPGDAVRVGFVQIFRQPNEYRGQLISTRGTVELAYRVAAPPNDFGIKDYCLLWLRPDDGTNIPIVVYALEPPAGFPPITTEQRKMREPVEVTGFFFKRWVYRAADGLNSVPLLLTKTPRWEPQAAPTRSHLRIAADEFGWTFWGTTIAGMLLVVSGLVWLMAKSTRSGRTPTELCAAPPDDDPAHWEHLATAPPVHEQLRRMEEEQ